MASGSRSFHKIIPLRWRHPFRQFWKPLTWIWVAIFLSIFVNIGSSWLITKTTSFDLQGTPLGWGIDHLWITLPLLLLLALLTLLAGLASLEEDPVPPASPLTLTPKQRLQLLRGLEQEYATQLASSLQGQMALELHLQERTDVIASSANLVFHHLETGEASPLPPGTSIIEAYDRAQRGLLILGAPGSGKTTLLLELIRELLKRAEADPDHPLTITLNLSSWARKQLSLEQWLGEQCSLVYGISKRLIVAWIGQEQVQFLLDGLDEMEVSARTACIDTINAYRQMHQVPLVVCSRSQEYESQTARLILPTAIEIQPLEPAQISKVLKQAGKPLAAVRAVLHRNTSLNDLLTTPLMLNIVLLTYRNKTAKDLPQQGSPQEQQRQIFQQYIEHMLKRYEQQRIFSLAQTRYTLTWLAQQMQRRHVTEFYVETLQPDWLSTKRSHIAYRLSVLVLGLGSGLAGGLMASWLGSRLVAVLISWLVIGLVAGLLFGLVIGQTDIKPVEALAWSWKRCRRGFTIGLASGLVSTLAVGQGGRLVCILAGRLTGRLACILAGGLTGGLAAGLVLTLVLGLSIGLAGGLSGSSLPKDVRLQPNQGIHASGWNAVHLGLVFLLVFGLVIGLGGVLVVGLIFGLKAGLFLGLLLGLGSSLTFGGVAYFQHYSLRLVLAQSRTLPWKAIPFLEEMTKCILLKRVGGGYQFIHPLLQEYFAALPLTATT